MLNKIARFLEGPYLRKLADMYLDNQLIINSIILIFGIIMYFRKNKKNSKRRIS